MLYLDLFLVGIGALAGGWACRRLGVPEVLGYLAAGILLGPGAHPGSSFVDQGTIGAIGRFAVLFRMFTLGLDFDARRLRGRWRPALTAGVAAMALSTLAGMLLAGLMGWSLLEGAVIGAALGTTSTNILSRALADRGISQREDARAAGAATLTEDLIAMSLIALLTVFSGPQDGARIVEDALELAVFACLAFTAGAILVPLALDRLGRSKSEELVTLATLGVLFGFAALSFELGAGVAIGAFLAGVAVGAARHAPGVSARVLPLRDVLAAIAYVSLGLLLDPAVILRMAPYAIPVSLAFVALKTTAVAVGLRGGGVPTVTAARAGAILGQAGTMGLVYVCTAFLPPAHHAELLAFAFVSWAFTVALTPLRLRFGPDAAEAIARALGARDLAPRSKRLRRADADMRESVGLAVRAFGCATALGALLGLLARGLPMLPEWIRLPIALLAGVVVGAAILPFALAAAAASRRAARHQAHEAAMRPRPLSRGRRDPARAYANAASAAGVAASLVVPVALAVALAPPGVRLALLASALAGSVALAARPALAERLGDDVERLAGRRVRERLDARLHDFRGVSPFGFEVDALHVRSGTAAAWATLRDLQIPERTNARVLAVLRPGTHDSAPLGPGTVLHPGDEVVLGGTPNALVRAKQVLVEPRSAPAEDRAPADVGRVDAQVPDGRGPRVPG